MPRPSSPRPVPGRPAPTIALFNRQRNRRIPPAPIRRLVCRVLEERGQTAELAVHWIGARRSDAMNRQYLGHPGPTDIITFDHGSTAECLRGELFICVPEAVRQSGEFSTSWQQEIRRYVIHGLLHLRGYDDLESRDRQRMKREEDRLVGKFA